MTYRELFTRLMEMGANTPTLFDKPAIFNDLEGNEWEIDDVDYTGDMIDEDGTDKDFVPGGRQISEPGDPVLTP